MIIILNDFGRSTGSAELVSIVVISCHIDKLVVVVLYPPGIQTSPVVVRSATAEVNRSAVVNTQHFKVVR